MLRRLRTVRMSGAVLAEFSPPAAASSGDGLELPDVPATDADGEDAEGEEVPEVPQGLHADPYAFRQGRHLELRWKSSCEGMHCLQ